MRTPIDIPPAWCDILFVGAGPKALMALADLDSELALSGPDVPRLRVMLCDPAQPGPGAVWDPEQPKHLRMNVDAGIVDVRCPAVPESYREWERRVLPANAGRRYPPRALVGRYLAWAYERLQESPRLQLQHVAARITGLTLHGNHWAAHGLTPDSTFDCRSPIVVLSTGHADSGGVDHRQVIASPRRGDAEPVTVTGAALTAFDVVLGLTEACGGRWEHQAGGQVRYLPSGDEPRRITITSRSGELLLPKPVADHSPLLDAVRESTMNLTEIGQPDERWWAIVAGAAAAGARVSGITIERQTLLSHLDTPIRAVTKADSWERDLVRAQGDTDDDPSWWWGRAWAGAYRNIVESLERTERDPELWLQWRRRAARLEKWAFGPPRETVAKLHALRRAGLLHVRAATTISPSSIHAVTAGPGILTFPLSPSRKPTTHDDLWGTLLSRGHVTVRPGERGVLTRPDAVCVTRSGRPNDGLAALGRPTEDPVIGHDTLNRTLHDDSRRWARSIVAWATGATVPAATIPYSRHERNYR